MASSCHSFIRLGNVQSVMLQISRWLHFVSIYAEAAERSTRLIHRRAKQIYPHDSPESD